MNKCAVCGARYMPGKNGGDLCGRIECDADRWSPDQWAGRARMAEARVVACIQLDALDRRALGWSA